MTEAVSIPGNLDEVPTDVDAIFNALGVKPEDDEVVTDDSATEGAGEAAQAAETKPAEAKPEKTDDPEKDAKLVPIGAVFEEREKNRALREKVAGMQARLEELEKAGQRGDQAAGGEVEGFTSDELAELEEAFPAVGKGLRTMQSRLERMEAENRELKAGRDRVIEEDAREQQTRSVQDAIAGVPKMAHLDKTLSVEAWNARVAPIDDQLRADPEFSKLPVADRLAKAVEIYEYRYGPVTLPTQSTQSTAAKAAAAIQAAGSPTPETLSDMPGGEVPNAPERDIDRMTAHDIASMSPEQIDRLISKLA